MTDQTTTSGMYDQTITSGMYDSLDNISVDHADATGFAVSAEPNTGTILFGIIDGGAALATPIPWDSIGDIVKTLVMAAWVSDPNTDKPSWVDTFGDVPNPFDTSEEAA